MSEGVSGVELQMIVRRLIQDPAQLCLFLSAISEPALLLTLGLGGCTINPLGAVNVRNRFELRSPELCRLLVQDVLQEEMGARNSIENVRYRVEARISPTPQLVKRGLEWEVKVQIRRLGQYERGGIVESHEEESLFVQYFYFLEFVARDDMRLTHDTKRSSGTENARWSESRKEKAVPTMVAATLGGKSQSASSSSSLLGFASGAPSLWAKVCKDYNPIHTSSIAARFFGFKGKIAHGNHVVAKALETQARENAEDMETIWKSSENSDTESCFSMETRFIRPVVVPCELGVRTKYNDAQKQEHETIRTGRLDGLEVFMLGQGQKICVEVDVGLTAPHVTHLG